MPPKKRLKLDFSAENMQKVAFQVEYENLKTQIRLAATNGNCSTEVEKVSPTAIERLYKDGFRVWYILDKDGKPKNVKITWNPTPPLGYI